MSLWSPCPRWLFTSFAFQMKVKVRWQEAHLFLKGCVREAPPSFLLIPLARALPHTQIQCVCQCGGENWRTLCTVGACRRPQGMALCPGAVAAGDCHRPSAEGEGRKQTWGGGSRAGGGSADPGEGTQSACGIAEVELKDGATGPQLLASFL